MGLASIMVRLGLDASGYQMGLKRVESTTQQFGKTIKNHLAGYFTLSFLASSARSIVEYASKITDLSKKTKINAETLQEWQFAAEQSGTSIDAFVRSFDFLSKKFPAKSQQELVEMFNEIARTVKSGSISNELAYVGELLGRTGKDLIPVFKDGLSDAANEAKRLGVIMKDDVIRSLDEFGDKLDKLKGAARGRTGGALAQAGTFILDTLNAAASGVAKVSAGFGARMMLSRTNLDPNEADRMAQDIAFKQVFRDPAMAEAMRGVSTFVGKKTPFMPDVAMDKDKVVSSSKWSMGSTNSLQTVGAFIGSQPVLVTEIKEQTRLLKKIEENTSETAIAVS